MRKGIPRGLCRILMLGIAGGLVPAVGCAEPSAAPVAPVQVAAAGGSKAPRADAAPDFGAYLAGHHAFRQRDFDAASRYMSDALKAQPPGPSLLRRALIAKLASGQVDSARSLARRLLVVQPSAALSKLALAVGELKVGAFESGKARLSAIGERGPGAFYGPLLSAWAEAGSGRYDAALAALAKTGEGSGESADFAAIHSLHAALILDLADRPQEAEKHYLDAAEKMQRPTVRFTQAIGSFYRRTGDAAEAERRYEAFLAEQSESPLVESALADLRAGKPASRIVTNAKEGAAEAFFSAAEMWTRARSIELALIFGQLALDLRPDFPSAHVLVGRILESVGLDEDAIEAYRLVDKASPLSWSARLRRANGLSSLGRNEEAIAVLRRMAGERKERADALTTLGDLYRVNKRFAESVEAYDAAIARIEPVDERHWRLLFSRGIARERSKNWPGAEEDLLAAMALSPNEPYLLNYLGYSWVDQGIKLEAARKLIERAVELEPRSGAIVDSLGWALYRMGEFDAAVTHLERAAELEPLDPTVNDHLGDAYWRVGRVKEAAFQWRRALNLDPEPDQVTIIEGKIARGLGEAKTGDKTR